MTPGQFLTYPQWLEGRISLIYSARLDARRKRGPIHSETRRAQWRAYKATAKGAASRKRYEAETGRETRAAYAASMPGLIAQAQARLNERAREHGARLVELQRFAS